MADTQARTYCAHNQTTEVKGDREAKRATRRLSGVIEARPGIIEDTHIDPLSETSNDDDGWSNVSASPTQGKVSQALAADTGSSTLSESSAATVATDAATAAYNKVTETTGNVIDVEQVEQRAVYGKSA